MPHYVGPNGLYFVPPAPEFEWPQVFVTGVLPPGTDKQYILMALEGWRMFRIDRDTPPNFRVGMRLIGAALGHINPEPGTLRRMAQARGINLEGEA